MSIISVHDNIEFESPKFLFAKIKRELKSYNSAGLIDENDFYDYIMEVLSDLGLSGLMEEEAVLTIENHKSVLPENFKSLYSVNLVKDISTHRVLRPQGGRVFFTDVVRENKCHINCCEDKITVRHYIEDEAFTRDYKMDRRLHIVSKKNHLKPHEIYFNNKLIHTGFEKGELYIKYYATPVDEDGLPMIPNIKSIQKAIELYIIYQLFLQWYWNGDIPDGVTQKAAETKSLYERAFSQATYEIKLPSFATAIDSIRSKRKSLDIYKQSDRFGNYRY